MNSTTEMPDEIGYNLVADVRNLKEVVAFLKDIERRYNVLCRPSITRKQAVNADELAYKVQKTINDLTYVIHRPD